MMKFLLTVLTTCLLASIGFAQITITGANLPGPGESYTYKTVDPPFGNIDVSLIGPNQNWDYSGLQGDSVEVVSYVFAAQTPYGLFFFNRFGTLVADTQSLGPGYEFTDVYLFFKKDAGAYIGEGLGLKFNQIPLPGFYSDMDTIYHLPLTYGKADTSTYRFFIGIPTVGSYSRTGARITHVDGWGTITTPAGTYSCLRVTSETDEMDSLVVQGNGFGFPVHQRTIQWLTDQDKVPVLEVTQAFTLNQWTTTGVRYLDQMTGRPEKAQDFHSIYHIQHGLNDQIRISGHPENRPDEIMVIDINGRVVFRQTNCGSEVTIQTGNWPTGIYFLNIRKDSKIYSAPMFQIVGAGVQMGE